jgi:tetratricopeptide (TPR) repeat protein
MNAVACGSLDSPLIMIRSLVCLLGVCFSVLLALSPALAQAARAPAKEETAAIVKQAENYLGAGKVDEAIQLLGTVPKTVTYYPQVAYLLGIAYHLKRDYVHAVEKLSVAVKGMPETSKEYGQAIQILGLCHYLLGHPSEAIPYLEQTHRLIPQSAEIAYALGTCYIQLHNPDKSRETFARMFKVPQSSAAAYLINGQMMVRQKFEELAEPELKKALAMDPRLPQVNFLLGEISIYHADIDRGIALLQKEIEINPTFALAHYWLGEAYTRQLKWDQAIAPLQKSIWLNPYFSGPYIALGKVYLKQGDLQNAEGMLRRATKMDPNNFSAHHLLAQVLQRAGRPEQAKEEFETAEKMRTSADKEP